MSKFIAIKVALVGPMLINVAHIVRVQPQRTMSRNPNTGNQLMMYGPETELVLIDGSVVRVEETITQIKEML